MPGVSGRDRLLDPMQAAVRDALIGLMGVLSQAQVKAMKGAQRGGIAHAKAKGEASPYRGRAPSYNRVRFDAVLNVLGQNSGVSAAAKTAGLSRQTVHRIQADLPGAKATLALWSDLRTRP